MVVTLIIPMLVYQFGDGLQINFANALRGISDVKPMMVIAFISYFVISLPVGYFCGFVRRLGRGGRMDGFPVWTDECGSDALAALPSSDEIRSRGSCLLRRQLPRRTR